MTLRNKEQAVSDAMVEAARKAVSYPRLSAAAFEAIYLAMKAASHPLEQQQAVSGDVVAKERADWLLDAVACATQDRRFLRGDPAYDENAGEAILLNGEKAISAALTASGVERWQPIESAPKDGRVRVLITGGRMVEDWPPGDKPFSGVVIARWTYSGDEFEWEGQKHAHDTYDYHAPTHWMPLPEPPALSPQQKDRDGE